MIVSRLSLRDIKPDQIELGFRLAEFINLDTIDENLDLIHEVLGSLREVEREDIDLAV